MVCDGGARPGQGTHASLSRFDLHNTLIANGPDFAAGLRDDAPSSNADLAPTISAILGLPVTAPFDGRVLDEAFKVAEGRHEPVPPSERLKAKGDGEAAGWRQYLQVTRFRGEDYLDEGNVDILPNPGG